MAAIRRSKQRDAIKAYLMSTTAHPTAEVVYENIKKDFPNISLGTVYRNLNFLVEHDEALRLDCGDGFDHFDGNTHPHNHFFCKSCALPVNATVSINRNATRHGDKVFNVLLMVLIF